MVKVEITNRFSGAVQFTAEIDCSDDATRSVKLGLAVKWALKSRADLAGANLASADLAGANLASADLARADLASANLAGAYLAGANLAGAYLARADLNGAYLAGANLAGANLASADLAGANLAGANLARADLNGADLAGANLAGANLASAYLAALIIDGGIRSDGFRFMLTRTDPGPWRVKAGCRDLTLKAAREHWTNTRAGTPLGDETFLILDHMEKLAVMREWPSKG